jgi:hypothetical protein
MQLVVVSPFFFFFFFAKAPKTISREELPENNIAARSARYLWSPACTAPEAVSWFFDAFESVVDSIHKFTTQNTVKKVKQSHYRPGQAHGVQGG